MAAISVDSRVTGQTVPRMDVVESIEQMTLIAASGGIAAGDLVIVNGNGEFAKAAVTAQADIDAIYGMATSTAPAGSPVTAINKGTVGGHNITQALGALVYANAAGAVGDAAGATAKVIGRVVPIRDAVAIKAIHISL